MSKGLFYLLIALQVVDLVTTLLAFKRGAVEANPLLAFLQRIFGRDGAIVVAKIGVVCVLAYTDLPVLGLAALCALYLVVVEQNIALIRRL